MTLEERMMMNMTDDHADAAAAASTTAAAACEACGWAAAFMSMLAFGSFGVPIKSKAAVSLDIDPLVMQSYKTAMCFLTSWLVLLDPNTPFTYTPWGIVSGLFWAPAGVATVYAVKKAGLAIAIGIGSSIIVLVSFIWGIIIFEERVRSRAGASFAILCMMMGLFGMSYFSNSPESESQSSSSASVAHESEVSLHELNAKVQTAESSSKPRLRAVAASSSYNAKISRSSESSSEQDVINTGDENINNESSVIIMSENKNKKSEIQLADRKRTQQTSTSADDEAFYYNDERNEKDETDELLAQRYDDKDGNDDDVAAAAHEHHHHPSRLVRLCCGITLTERQCGMLAAVFNGTWGGSIMTPMKWCKADTKGVSYLISFAIGASIVTMGMWVVRFLYYHHQLGSVKAAYQQLPSFHFRVLWLAGGMCGLLWSIGNFFSLISVYYLGQGVGYPLVQTNMVVSGLWGIFYFKEVQGTQRITKWFLSSLLTLFSILLLGYEHQSD